MHIPPSLTQCYTSTINISTVLTIPPYPLHFTKENKSKEKGKGKLTPQLPHPQLEHCPLHAQEEQAHGAISSILVFFVEEGRVWDAFVCLFVYLFEVMTD